MLSVQGSGHTRGFVVLVGAGRGGDGTSQLFCSVSRLDAGLSLSTGHSPMSQGVQGIQAGLMHLVSCILARPLAYIHSACVPARHMQLSPTVPALLDLDRPGRAYGQDSLGSERKCAARCSDASLLTAILTISLPVCVSAQRRGVGALAGPRCRVAAASKKSSGSLRTRLIKGLRSKDAPDPVAEFRALRDDPLASWCFLNDAQSSQRAALALAIAFLPSFGLVSKLFPFASETGELLPRNILSDVLYSASLACSMVVAILLWIGYKQVKVNQLLRERSIYFEMGGGGYYLKQKSKDAVRKDALIQRYETAPGIARLRRYVLSGLLVAVATTGAGLVTGGEIRRIEEEEDADNGFD